MKNNLRKARNLFVSCVPMTMLALLPFVNSCDKQEQPTRPERHIGTQDMTLDFNFTNDWDKLTDDTLIYLANHDDVKWVILNYVDSTDATANFTASQFNKKRLILGIYYDAYDNVVGNGTIRVNANSGAQLPESSTNELGMTAEDSAALAKYGFKIQRADTTRSR